VAEITNLSKRLTRTAHRSLGYVPGHTVLVGISINVLVTLVAVLVSEARLNRKGYKNSDIIASMIKRNIRMF